MIGLRASAHGRPGRRYRVDAAMLVRLFSGYRSVAELHVKGIDLFSSNTNWRSSYFSPVYVRPLFLYCLNE
jgi:hypothetical protein